MYLQFCSLRTVDITYLANKQSQILGMVVDSSELVSALDTLNNSIHSINLKLQ